MTVRPGLCETCEFAHRIATARGTVYWRCKAPERRKYPVLPVRSCASYSERLEAPAEAPVDDETESEAR